MSKDANVYENFQPPPSQPPAYPGLSNHPPQYHQPQQHGPQILQPTLIPGPGVTIVDRNTVVVAGSGLVQVVPLGFKPAALTCRACHAQVVTKPRSRPTMRTHLIALILCVMCCWPCVCVPYCMESCQNVEHYCPNCDTFLGVHHN